MIKNVKVPINRIRVLNSKDQKFKKEIEKELGVKIQFFGNTVELDGDGLGVMIAETIVKAIGRGFSPVRARPLFKEDATLDIIDMSPMGENKMKTMKARIIGTDGRTRERIENNTGSFVSVYGKTVSIIGTFESVKNAKKAVKMFINGSTHKTVYRFLEGLK